MRDQQRRQALLSCSTSSPAWLGTTAQLGCAGAKSKPATTCPVSCVAEVVRTCCGGELIGQVADAVPDRWKQSLIGPSQQFLELGEDHLDWREPQGGSRIEVVGRKEHQMCPCLADRVPQGLGFMASRSSCFRMPESASRCGRQARGCVASCATM